MSVPPRPIDDASIKDEDALYRLIPTELCAAVDGEWIFQSWAFDNTTDTLEMSVVLDDTLRSFERVPEGLPEKHHPTRPERWGVAVLTAGCARAVPGQEVERSPDADEPAHGGVVGSKPGKRRQKLKKCAEWVVPPAAPAA